MGAAEFMTSAYAKPSEKIETVFRHTVESAQFEHGHGGYTGTIAEKSGDGFHTITFKKGTRRSTKIKHARKLLRDDDRRFGKWGPCGCIDLGLRKRDGHWMREWLFFGIASE